MDHLPIDVEHEAIFTISMEIIELWERHGKASELRVLVDKPGKVLQAHFHYEEGVLTDIRYPKLEEHRAEHETMLRELAVLRQRLANMDQQGSAYPGPGYLVLNYILGVTVGHIFHGDLDYCLHARELARRADQAPAAP